MTREELDARILLPLAAGRPVELNERRWSPEKVKVAIYEGPALAIVRVPPPTAASGEPLAVSSLQLGLSPNDRLAQGHVSLCSHS